MHGNSINRYGIYNSNYKHGLRNTRLFSIWANIKTRCTNSNSTFYNRYGGRGITICDEWKDNFKAFYDWAMANGYQDNLTIDRIDNNGNYEPNNCRWVTVKDQARNKTNNHLYTINNETKALSVWCEQFNINYKTVRDRLKRGWNIKKALSCPVDIRFRRKVK